jgi:diaminopimelate decarboxylase
MDEFAHRWGRSASSFAKEFGTPLFVIDEADFMERAQRLA